MNGRWLLGIVGAFAGTAVLAGAAVASADVRDRVPGGEVLDRVAGILGIERAELDDAFAQARSEIADEKLDAALADLVENGTLTAEEADEIRAWIEARPNALDALATGRFHRPGFHRHGHAGAGGALRIPSISPDHLDRLIETGLLTEADADEVRDWLDSRPEAVDKLSTGKLRPAGPRFEGAPFHGGGFYRFDEEGDFDLDGLLERFGSLGERLEGRIPRLHPDAEDFELPGEGFFEFDDDGFQFEFRGFGPGFFFRGGPGESRRLPGHERFHPAQPGAGGGSGPESARL